MQIRLQFITIVFGAWTATTLTDAFATFSIVATSRKNHAVMKLYDIRDDKQAGTNEIVENIEKSYKSVKETAQDAYETTKDFVETEYKSAKHEVEEETRDRQAEDSYSLDPTTDSVKKYRQEQREDEALREAMDEGAEAF